jgi:hypothetical protein
MTFDYEESSFLSMLDPTFHFEFASLSPQKLMFPNKATIFSSCSSFTTIYNFSKYFFAIHHVCHFLPKPKAC